MNDTLKIQFPYYKSQWVWLGIKRNGDLKLHWDGSDINLPREKKLNLFANLKTSTTFSKCVFRVGCNFFGDHHEFSSRLAFGGCGDSNCPTLSSKYLYKQGPFFAGFFTQLSAPTYVPVQWNTLFGYLKDNYKFYFQYDFSGSKGSETTPSKPCFLQGKVTATGVYKLDKKTFGAEACYDIE